MSFSKKLLEYGLPIAIGVGLGFGILQLMQAARPEACLLVEKWDVNDVDAQFALEEELIALGEDARKDLRQAFLECTDPAFPDQQVWVGRILADKPFLDSRFLYKLAREGEGWPRRTASVALVDVLDREVDVAVVLPGIFEWLEDLTVDYHVPAIAAAGALLSNELIPPHEIDRLEAAFIALGDRKGRGLPGRSSGEDGDISIDDRMTVASAIGPLVSRPKTKRFLVGMMGDTDEFEEVRVRAIQTLSVAGAFVDDQLDLTAVWKAAARDEAGVMRQTTIENLFRCRDATFNDVIAEAHGDAESVVRRASLWSQMKRGMPTMLPEFHQLAEDHDEWVRFDVILAAAQFKAHDGTALRAGHILRFLEKSDNRVVVMASFIALYRMTSQSYGIPEEKVFDQRDEVEDKALEGFMNDPEGRRLATEKFAAHWGGAAVFTDDELRAVLEELLKHKDPANVERARAELAK